MEDYYLYVLRLSGWRFYVGITTNFMQRFQQHLCGHGSTATNKYTVIGILGVIYLGRMSYKDAQKYEDGQVIYLTSKQYDLGWDKNSETLSVGKRSRYTTIGGKFHFGLAYKEAVSLINEYAGFYFCNLVPFPDTVSTSQVYKLEVVDGEEAIQTIDDLVQPEKSKIFDKKMLKTLKSIEPKKKRIPPVILALKEEFDIGQAFTLADVDRLGNRKSFYNYKERNPGEFQELEKDGRKAWIFV